MTRPLMLACVFTLAGAISALAQGANTAPVPCPDCAKGAAEAAPIRQQIDARQAELRQQQQDQGTNDANLNNLRQLRQEAARAGDQAAVQQHEQSINDLQADRTANREEQFKTQQEIEKLNQELERIGRNVDACNKQCGAVDSKLPTGTVTTGGTEIVVGGTPQPPRRVGVPTLRKPPCEDCEGFDELERAHQELQRRAERANARGSLDELRDFEEQRRTVRELQRRVDDCRKTCKPRTTSFRNPRVLGAVGGLVAGGLVILGGSGDTNTTALTPIQTPAPTPVAPMPPVTTPPSPPEPPAPAPRADGDYACINCGVPADGGRHDPNIQLCRFILSLFSVREGSITISHPAPFVAISGDYNASTGVFDATGRGVVAGFPNVGVRGTGTVNTTTGRITMMYTMGTGGELPGGQPIVYSLTLQKQ